MFGTYRLILSLCVMYSHVAVFHHLCGGYAVFGFFVLSGWMMTRTLEENYLGRPHGVKVFWVNRLLRIYPVYLFGAILAYAVVMTGPLTLYGEIHAPKNLMDWFDNLTIANIPLRPEGWRILSIAWSLQSELWFYFIIPLLMMRPTLWRVWLILSAAMLVWHMFTGGKFYWRYIVPWAAWPAFAAGSALAHWRKRIPVMPVWGMVIAAMGASYFLVYPNNTGFAPLGAGFYVSTFFQFLCVWALSGISCERWKPVDKALGDLSYPVLILHLPVSELVRRLLPESVRSYSVELFLIAAVAVLLAAYLSHLAIERPVQRLRARLRAQVS